MNRLAILLPAVAAVVMLSAISCGGSDAGSPGKEATPARTNEVRQASPKPKPTPEPTPEPTPAPPPGWTRHAAAGFEIDLPDTWETWDPTEETGEAIVQTLEGSNPKLAEAAREFISGPEAPGWAFAALDTDSPPDYLRNLNIFEEEHPEAPTTVRQLIAISEEMLPDLGATLLSSDADMTIGGARAGMIEVALVCECGELRQVHYIVMPTPTHAFTLTFSAASGDYPDLERTFRQIAQSFRLPEGDEQA